MAIRYRSDDRLIEITVTQPSAPNSIKPMLQLLFTFSNRSENKIKLHGFSFYMGLSSSIGAYYRGPPISFSESQIELDRNASQYISGYVWLDYQILKRIEELRGDGDVVFHIDGGFLGTYLGESMPISTQFGGAGSGGFQFRIPKSDWVERFLPALDCARARENIIQYLNSAWKQKHMGQYDKVLTDCRLTIEGLRRLILSHGFKNEEVERADKLDWKKYLDSDSIGDIVSKITNRFIVFHP